MRLIGTASTVFTLALTLGISGIGPAPAAHERRGHDQDRRGQDQDDDQQGEMHGGRQVREGQQIFRFDTFGDEQFWTNVLRMQEAVAQVSPATALAVGLKVDVDALPASVVNALKAGQVNLNDPAVTIALLQLNAVLGIKGTVDSTGHLATIGVTCALCHSTVDNSLTQGIGHRLDGWANRTLNVGAVVALSPALPDDLKALFRTWGPGRYDARHHIFDGMNLQILHPTTVPVEIPSIFGLKGVGFETYTADGPISYWNAYVGISQMGGKGSFSDPRIGVTITQTPDLVTPKLPALLAYQLSLREPSPPARSFDEEAARRGRRLFRNEAGCANCHQGNLFTDVLDVRGPDRPLVHTPAEDGADPAYAQRTATGGYRTTPLRALWQHPPYFHDGSAPDLLAVVNHYDQLFALHLTAAQKADLVEYLKSI